MTAIMTIGVSASGKSTWAEKQVARDPQHVREVNRDKIRARVLKEKTGEDFSWGAWKWAWEDEVTRIHREEIVAAAQDEDCDTLIISDTDLNPKHNRDLRRFLETQGFVVEVKYFHVSYETAVKRDAKRANPVGQQVISKQCKAFDELVKSRVEPNPAQPHAMIVDLDGTLAHFNGRGPYEWDKVSTDTLDEQVAKIVRRQAVTHSIVIVTGRSDVCYCDTYAWLVDNEIPFDALYMRADGDYRPDYIVKREILENDVCPAYEVIKAIDNSTRICNMYRGAGLSVMQVNVEE